MSAPVGLDTVFVVNYYKNDTKSDLVFWIDLTTLRIHPNKNEEILL